MTLSKRLLKTFWDREELLIEEEISSHFYSENPCFSCLHHYFLCLWSDFLLNIHCMYCHEFYVLLVSFRPQPHVNTFPTVDNTKSFCEQCRSRSDCTERAV